MDGIEPNDIITERGLMAGAFPISGYKDINTGSFEFTDVADADVDTMLTVDRPGRTMLTSESTKNRSTHVVADPATGRLRLLTEIEAERLQGFDDDWTKNCLVEGEVVEMPKRMRYFCMGNALVVPMITRMGKGLDEIIFKEK